MKLRHNLILSIILIEIVFLLFSTKYESPSINYQAQKEFIELEIVNTFADCSNEHIVQDDLSALKETESMNILIAPIEYAPDGSNIEKTNYKNFSKGTKGKYKIK